QQVAAARLAAGREVLVRLDERLLFGGVIEDRVGRDVCVLLRPAHACDGRALGDAARIPGHEVETRVEVAQRGHVAAQELDPRLAWTAWIHEHRTYARRL